MKPTPKEKEQHEPAHLPVEPEMDKVPNPDPTGPAPTSEPEKEKHTGNL
jgi:hypothetical protein